MKKAVSTAVHYSKEWYFSSFNLVHENDIEIREWYTN